MAVLTVTLLPASASAAGVTWHVETTGADSVTCGPIATPCLTVAQGVLNAQTDDIVEIGPGTFPIANSIPVPANENLEIRGAGQGITILDGLSSTTWTTSGMFRFLGTGTGPTASSTTQKLHDFTIIRTGKTAGSAIRFGLLAQMSQLRSVAIDAHDITFTGSAQSEIALYTSGNPGHVQLRDSTITNLVGNTILIEQHIGPITVTGNTITPTSTSTNAPIYAFTFKPASPTNPVTGVVTGHYEISDNVITAHSGIAIVSGFGGQVDAAYTGGIDITGNEFNALSATGSGISVSNVSAAADGGLGDVLDVNIADNVLTGVGDGSGVTISGRVTSPAIVHNDIRGFAAGVSVLPSAAGAASTGVTVNRNQLVGNPTAGLLHSTISSTDATNNWWGCNAGPGNPGCDIVSGSGSITTDPRLVLSIGATPVSIGPAGTSAITADIGRNNLGAAVSVFDDGFIVPFTATGGTVSPTSDGLMAGVAETTFQSVATAGRSVSATVDNQTVTHTFADRVALTITTITHDLNGNLVADIAQGSSAITGCSFTYSRDGAPPSFLLGTVDLAGDCVATIPGGLLTPGAWALTATASDADGNTATASDTFTITAPSIPTITASAAGNLVADIVPGDGAVTGCSFTYSRDGAPPTFLAGTLNGSGDCVATVPGGMATGIWDITATATDANGYTATGAQSFLFGAGPVTPPGGGTPTTPSPVATSPVVPTVPAPAPVDANAALLACAKSSIAITDISQRSGRVRILGVTTKASAGEEVAIEFASPGEIVATAVVTADGSFRATAPLPARTIRNTNRARYRASLDTSRTPWLKLTRRLQLTGLHTAGSDLEVGGYLKKPLIAGARVTVTSQSSCGASPQVIAQLTVARNGRFHRVIPIPSTASGFVVRLTARVRTARGGEARTYSIARPIQVR